MLLVEITHMLALELISSDCSSQIEAMNIQMSTLKNDLEREHEKWRVAQRNYERQVC